jgi:hypothetical protein
MVVQLGSLSVMVVQLGSLSVMVVLLGCLSAVVVLLGCLSVLVVQLVRLLVAVLPGGFPGSLAVTILPGVLFGSLAVVVLPGSLAVAILAMAILADTSQIRSWSRPDCSQWILQETLFWMVPVARVHLIRMPVFQSLVPDKKKDYWVYS